MSLSHEQVIEHLDGVAARNPRCFLTWRTPAHISPYGERTIDTMMWASWSADEKVAFLRELNEMGVANGEAIP